MKRNRWKNRLSLLLVALMLFTAFAPVALAVGEPEAVAKVDEPAESDKVSEDQNEPPRTRTGGRGQARCQRRSDVGSRGRGNRDEDHLCQQK